MTQKSYSLFALFFLHLCCQKVYTQSPDCKEKTGKNIQPVALWSFDDPANWGVNSMQGGNPLTCKTAPNIKSENGGIKGYLSLNNETDIIQEKKGTVEDNSTTQSAEFLFRFRENYGMLNITIANTTIRMNFSGIIIHELGGTPKKVGITFKGTDKNTFSYYLDKKWHHFAINDTDKGKEFWIDGELLQTSAATEKAEGEAEEPAASTPNRLLSLHQSKSIYAYQFLGDIDEIAIYNSPLPPTFIYKHYIEATQSLQKYDFTDNYKASCLPTPQMVIQSYNPKDFAPLNLSIEDGSYQQLKNFPLPRYRKGHGLLPNGPSFNIESMVTPYPAGEGKITASQKMQSYDLASGVQVELAKNWNYYLRLEYFKVTEKTKPVYRDTLNNLNARFIQNANRLPQYPVYMSAPVPNSFRSISYKKYLAPKCGNGGHYVCDGDSVVLSKNRYIISPICPTTSFIKDGQDCRKELIGMKELLKRPINLFFSNGEAIIAATGDAYRGHPEGDPKLFAKDPRILADYAKYKPAGDYPKTWYTYDSERRFRRLQNAFRDQFLNPKDPALSGLVTAQTKFIQYQIGGDWAPYRFQYKVAREIMTPFQYGYYFTEDFYPFTPSNWHKRNVGAVNCLGRIRESLASALAAGDKFFSPFIDPYPYVYPRWSDTGMDLDNGAYRDGITPAQWLGLLKYNAVLGAEFFYTFYYRQCGNKTGCREHGNNYVWMVTTPCYAQALMTRFEDIFRNGNVMDGHHPMTDASTNINERFKFFAKDDRMLVGARKKGNTFLITGNINPLSNIVGNEPAEGIAEIQLENQSLKFHVRRQGSMYFYDKSGSAPVFYQVDGWHEGSHPYYWNKGFVFEAELYDNPPQTFEIKTENLRINGDLIDATNANSYIIFSNSNVAKGVNFEFQPRNTNPNSFTLKVKCRTKNKEKIDVWLDNVKIGSISASSESWNWEILSTKLSNLKPDQEHVLTLKPSSTKIEIDAVVLTAEP